MTAQDIACVVVGFFWGYLFVPVYVFAKLVADLWAADRWLEKPRWSDQSTLWKVTIICAAVFTYLTYLAVGIGVLNMFKPHISEPENAGRLFALGLVDGFLTCSALTARSTWTRRKRRAS
jgi:hypothetical protein